MKQGLFSALFPKKRYIVISTSKTVNQIEGNVKRPIGFGDHLWEAPLQCLRFIEFAKLYVITFYMFYNPGDQCII
jgi:hypothetical protein